MFIILLEYLVPVEEVDRHLEPHQRWVADGFAAGVFLAAGPQVPRTGGMIVAHRASRAEIEALAAADPFVINGVARSTVIEMDPRRVAPEMAFLKG